MFAKPLAVVMLLAVGGAGLAGDQASTLKPLAPYVNDMTFLVVRIDAARVKPDDVIRRLDQIFRAHVPPDKKELPDIHARFIRAGGKEIFAVLNFGEAGPEPLIVVTTTADADKAALKELMQKGPDARVEEKGGVLLVGPEKYVTAALSRQAKAVPELAKAFAAVESSTAQIILLPPRPFLRAQEEVSPNLPKELGGGPITVITKGFQWAAVGIDVSPKFNIKAVAQATDAEAAEKLSELAGRVVNGLVAAEHDVTGLAPILPMLKPKVNGSQLVLNLDDKAVDKVLTPSVKKVQAAAARAQSTNNLKQMALAMHNYHDVHGTFPAVANHDANMKPLLSWRVHILPYLEQDQLYKEFKLDEPWDSEHNKTLIAKMPMIYQSPVAGKLAAGKTVYVGPSGEGMMFGSDKGLKLSQITDGTSNTIMIVEANDANAATWTKPDDFKPNKKDPTAGLIRKDTNGFHAAFADGSVRMIGNNAAADLFWALLTVAGGEVIPNK